MPYRRRLTHTRYPQHLKSFFPSRIRIERIIVTQSASGEESPDSFEVVYDNIPAAISAVIRLGEEWRNWRLEFVLEQVTHRTMLLGYYPDIKASDRMVTDAGEIHNITGRHLDSHSTLTRLDTRIVSPEAVAGIG
jgi:hypothetical protein